MRRGGRSIKRTTSVEADSRWVTDIAVISEKGLAAFHRRRGLAWRPGISFLVARRRPQYFDIVSWERPACRPLTVGRRESLHGPAVAKRSALCTGDECHSAALRVFLGYARGGAQTECFVYTSNRSAMATGKEVLGNTYLDSAPYTASQPSRQARSPQLH